MVKIQYGTMLKEGYFKVQFLDRYFSYIFKWFIWKFSFNNFSFENLVLTMIFQQRTSTKIWTGQIFGPFNGKWVLIQTSITRPKKFLFSRKIQKSSQPSLIFNNNIVTQSITQKDFRIFLDTKLDFQEHLSRVYLVKLTKQLVYYGSSTTHCQDRF